MSLIVMTISPNHFVENDITNGQHNISEVESPSVIKTTVHPSIVTLAERKHQLVMPFPANSDSVCYTSCSSLTASSFLFAVA